MAKTKAGLPDGFDLKVGKEDLVMTPARLPGYLERNTQKFLVEEPEEMPAQIVVEQEAPVRQAVAATPKQPVVFPSKVIPVPVQPKVEQQESQFQPPIEEPKPVAVKKARAPVRRLQINLSSEAQAKMEELVVLISEQSREKGVNYNDILQALIISLYDARTDLDVSQLPLRGRWGSPTAKSFTAALAQVIREALAQHSGNRGDSLRKVVGG